MSGIVIKAEGIGKSYLIDHKSKEKYVVLRDVIADKTKGLWSKIRNPRSYTHEDIEEFWALKDVSFEVKQGERIGIIGRNGAGKSTLLKILSRITEPTTGMVSIKGRVASLLEVGTGFNPELTGRENIYLNGAILGMTSAEIKRKFDEIVDFAEVEKFLDTPVKRFSSGMYVRLAFAVAAHLEPEILVVDEVLAVGDASFQKKCLGKMEDAGKENRTVLFVSHNMQAIRNLCPRCILLNNGLKVIDDNTDKTMYQYNEILRGINIDENTCILNENFRRGYGAIRFVSIEILNDVGIKCFSFKMGEKIKFKMSYKIFKEIDGLKIYIALRSGITKEIVTSIEHILSEKVLAPGCSGDITVELFDAAIRPGEYPLYFHLGDKINTPLSIDVVDDVTPPLVIRNESIGGQNNFDIERVIGCFSIPSRIISNEIRGC